VFGSLEALSALGPLLLGAAPYLFAFRHQHRDKQFLDSVSERFLGVPLDGGAPPRRAWFADALTDVNGVSTLVHQMGRLAECFGHDLTLISFAERAPDAPRVRNFTPIGQFSIPEHEHLVLAFPPVLDVLEYCDREQFTELIVSTPGLAGLAALAAGKLLNIRLVGIYHSDLPRYIRYSTDDDAMESAAWRYLRWFYDQMDVIYVPSRAYRRELLEKGFDGRKLRLFPHGADTERFHPLHRLPGFWQRYGAAANLTVTYVGRVAKEKDLDVLAEAIGRLAPKRRDCTFVIVGDGPLLPRLREQLRHTNVVFTGFLFDRTLSSAYASSDVFVCPSTTDTFGSAVLEAMASGVPVIVSSVGGPAEIVRHEETGLITRGRDVQDLAAAIERLLDDADLRRRLGEAGRRHAEACSWDRLYLEFWEDSGRAQPSVPSMGAVAVG
jgi:glycosyltransferase involved in cell wall biosynthesis